MKNYVLDGKTFPVTTPSAVESGDGVRIGTLFGIASYDAAANEKVEIVTVGVFNLPKDPNQAWSVGEAAYWDGAQCTNAPGTGDLHIGCIVYQAGATDPRGFVRLNPSTPAAAF